MELPSCMAGLRTIPGVVGSSGAILNSRLRAPPLPSGLTSAEVAEGVRCPPGLHDFRLLLFLSAGRLDSSAATLFRRFRADRSLGVSSGELSSTIG